MSSLSILAMFAVVVSSTRETAQRAPPAQPARHGVVGAPDGGFVEGCGNLGKLVAFANDQTVHRDGPVAERQRAVGEQHPLERLRHWKRVQGVRLDFKHELANAV